MASISNIQLISIQSLKATYLLCFDFQQALNVLYVATNYIIMCTWLLNGFL